MIPLNLDIPPTKSDSYFWADYIELQCLADIDGEVSKASVLDRLTEARDLVDKSVIHGEIFDGSATSDNISVAERSDKQAQKVNDWFNHLEYRQQAFASNYPFKLTNDHNTLVRVRPISKRKKLYIFFLLASNLRLIEKKFWPDITAAFEYACGIALSSCFPTGADIYVFGRNKLNKNSKYSGLLWDKIVQLADDLSERVLVEEDNFKPGNTGDNGLDIVGWVPLKDSQPGLLIVFGQCTSEVGWPSKQWESSIMNWGEVMTFKSDPANFIFIPYCFRDPTGAWYNHREIQQSVLVDRLRIFELLRGKHKNLRKITYELAEKILEYKEPVI